MKTFSLTITAILLMCSTLNLGAFAQETADQEAANNEAIERPPLPNLEPDPLPAPDLLVGTPADDVTIDPQLTIQPDQVDSTHTEDLFARDSYNLRTIVCPFKGSVDYDAGDISCQMLEVPENREKKRSRMIELHVVKIAAKKPEDWDKVEEGEEEKDEWTRRDDPVIYLTGGPGVTATTYVSRLKEHGVRDHRDLYILEQRGIGYSGDFCPIFGFGDPAPSNKPTFEDAQEGSIAAIEQCFKTAKANKTDLSGYSTIENARDVKALRQALGIDQWNVWGISYGSILGQAYLREDPSGISAAVIDAIVPLEPGAHHYRIGRHFARDLELLKSLCDADEKCAATFPDFVERLKAAVNTVSNKPIELDALDTELFPSGKAWLFHDIIAGIPFSALYEQDNYPTLPAMIDAIATMVEEEDYERLRVVTSGQGAGGGTGFISQGMYNAIGCNDGWFRDAPKTLREDQLEEPEFGSLSGIPALAEKLAKVCKRYGMKPRDKADYAPLKTDVRTLIINGQMDPITPPPLAKRIVPGFSNGDYIEVEYTGHGPTRSVECAGDFLTKFFDAPDNEVDTSCFDEVEPPEFKGKLFKSSGLLKLAVLAEEDEKKMALPAVWIGLSAIILVLGTLIYTVAPIARVINGSTNAATRSTGGARPLAWLTSLVGSTAIIGLAYGAYATFEADQALALVGLLGFTQWFSVAGLAAGGLGLALLFLSFRARRQEPLPIGTLLGLILTGFAGIGLASFLIFWGFSPFS